MPFRERWTVTLSEDLRAMAPWGPGLILLGYGNGLLEARETTKGEVVAQGFSPFGGGSGGNPVYRVAHCRNGLGVVSGYNGGGSHSHFLSTVAVNATAGELTTTSFDFLPFFRGEPVAGRDDSVQESTIMRDNKTFRQQTFAFDEPVQELAAGPTGGLVVVPFRRLAVHPTFGDLRSIGGGVLATWFDVADSGEITWTASRGQIANYRDNGVGTPGNEGRYNFIGDYFAPVGNLRHVSGNAFRDVRHVYDRDKPMPIATYAAPFFSDGTTTYAAANGTVLANLVPRSIEQVNT